MANVGHSFAPRHNKTTVLLPGITKHNTIGKIDCSFDPGHISMCGKIYDTTQPFLLHGH